MPPENKNALLEKIDVCCLLTKSITDRLQRADWLKETRPILATRKTTLEAPEDTEREREKTTDSSNSFLNDEDEHKPCCSTAFIFEYHSSESVDKTLYHKDDGFFF